MSKENKDTLAAYQKTANIYLSNSLRHDKINPIRAENKFNSLKKFLKSNLMQLKKDAKIFEIGSGSGSNAKYIESLGYKVTASDVADGFIDEIKSKNLNTIKFNVLEDEFPEKYSAILAWRVFVHFTPEDIYEVLKKSYEALEKDGIIIFNVINKEVRKVSDEWVDFDGEYHMGIKRYYHYYTKSELDYIISKTNFKIKSFLKEGGENNDKWLVYVLQKK